MELMALNPYMKNGLAHCYHLGESTVILGNSAVILKFHSIFDEIHDDSLTTAEAEGEVRYL